MGSRGPVPKRDAERRRRNKPDRPTDTIAKTGTVRAPAMDHTWHPRARAIWRAAKKSGQTDYYEPTDWQMLAYACDLMTSILGASRPSAQMVASLNSLLSSLGLTEGDRRRMRIEIDRLPEAAPADVTEMDEYRRARQG